MKVFSMKKTTFSSLCLSAALSHLVWHSLLPSVSPAEDDTPRNFPFQEGKNANVSLAGSDDAIEPQRSFSFLQRPLRVASKLHIVLSRQSPTAAATILPPKTVDQSVSNHAGSQESNVAEKPEGTLRRVNDSEHGSSTFRSDQRTASATKLTWKDQNEKTTSLEGRAGASVRQTTDEHRLRLRRELDELDADQKQMESLKKTLEASRQRRQQQLRAHSEKFVLAEPQRKSRNPEDTKVTHVTSTNRTVAHTAHVPSDLRRSIKGTSTTQAVISKAEKQNAVQSHERPLHDSAKTKLSYAASNDNDHRDITLNRRFPESLTAEGRIRKFPDMERSTSIPSRKNFSSDDAKENGKEDAKKETSIHQNIVSSPTTKSVRESEEGRSKTIFDTLVSVNDKMAYKQLETEANQFLRAIDNGIKSKTKPSTQPPLMKIPTVDFSDPLDMAELKNPIISPDVTESAIRKATEIMQKYADNASELNKPLFPSGTLHIVHAEPSSHPGCPNARSNWSACTAKCGTGSRVRFIRGLKEEGVCLTTQEKEACILSSGCTTGEEFLLNTIKQNLEFPKSSLEEIGRRMIKTIKISKHKDVSCATFDTGFTDRVYMRDGNLLEGDGAGYRFRLRVFINPERSNCGLEEESQIVRNFFPPTLEDFNKHMIGAHDTFRNSYGLGTLKFNNVVAASMQKYLESQDMNARCAMEHSPREKRLLPGQRTALGENLMTSCYDRTFPMHATDLWISEANCYKHGRIGNPCTGVLGPKCDTSTHAKGLMTGHYTAASWASSSEIGCGYRVCKNECFKGVPRILIGCQYFPGGNIVGEVPFDENIVKRLSKDYPQMLPEASEDEDDVRRCQRFREEQEKETLKRKTTFVDP